MKKLGILLLVFGVFFTSEINAIDYSANESYYQKLCRKQSGYRANKTTCQGYENYLEEKAKEIKDNTKSIENQIDSIKDDISELIVLIRENEELIAKNGIYAQLWKRQTGGFLIEQKVVQGQD